MVAGGFGKPFRASKKIKQLLGNQLWVGLVLATLSIQTKMAHGKWHMAQRRQCIGKETDMVANALACFFVSIYNGIKYLFVSMYNGIKYVCTALFNGIKYVSEATRAVRGGASSTL